MKAVHYLNQFFAGMGGEEQAETPPTRLDGAVGPGRGLAAALEGVEIVATLACGDDYFAEHENQALAALLEMLAEIEPDVLVAGPAVRLGPVRLRLRALRGGGGRARDPCRRSHARRKPGGERRPARPTSYRPP